MANPKHPGGYSQMWWNLVEVFRKKPDGFSFSFTEKKDADKMRFRFYAFREAVKRGVKDKDKELAEQCMEALPYLTNMKMFIKTEENGTISVAVRPAKLISNVTEQAVNGQLMSMLAGVADEEEETSSFDTEDVDTSGQSSLDVLGFYKD